MLLDQHLPDADGLEWLRQAHDQQPDVPVIVLSAHSTVDHAVDAVKRGAFHYVAKDGNLDALTLLVRQALDASALRRQVRRLRTTGPGPGADAVEEWSGKLTAINHRIKQAQDRAAKADDPTVYLDLLGTLGESGRRSLPGWRRPRRTPRTRRATRRARRRHLSSCSPAQKAKSARTCAGGSKPRWVG